MRGNPQPEVSDWIVKPPDERLLFQALERALTRQNQNVKVLVVEDDLDLARSLPCSSAMALKLFTPRQERKIQLSQRIFPHLVVLDLVLRSATALL